MNKLGCMILAVMGAFTLLATEYFVDDDNYGKSGLTGATEELAFGTIQDAVDAATKAGDIVTVLPGNYQYGGQNNARVYIANNKIILRGTAGHRNDTIIWGERDGGTVGANAIRGVFIAAAAGGTIVKGLTIMFGTTGASGIGGGLYYAGNDFTVYVSDCQFRDCLAWRGGAVAKVYVHRCLFVDNHATNEASCCYDLGAAYYSVFVSNSGRNLFDYCSRALINCTFYNNGNYFFGTGCSGARIYNCLAVKNSKDIGESNVTYASKLYNFVTDRKDADTKRSEGSDNLFEQDAYQLYAPALGDFRLVTGATAATAGNASYLSQVYIPKNSGIENLDYAGNSMAGKTSGAIAAGAVQATATPASGRVQFEQAYRGDDCSLASLGVLADAAGLPTIPGYAYFDTWPTQVCMKTFAPAAKVWGVSAYGASSRYHFPDMSGVVHFMPPPSTATSDLSLSLLLAYAELKVDPTGADGAYTTLQAAVDAAVAGKRTLITAGAGEYTSGGAHLNGLNNRVAIENKNVRIVGAGRGQSYIVGAADSSTANGLGAEATRCVAMSNAIAVVQGFTLTGGHSGSGNSYYAEGGGYVAGFAGTEPAYHFLIDSEITAITGAYEVVAQKAELLRCTIHDIKATVARGMFGSCYLNACHARDFSSPRNVEWNGSHVDTDCRVYFSTIFGDKDHYVIRPYAHSFFSIFEGSINVDLRSGYLTKAVIFHNCGTIDNQSGAIYDTSDPKFRYASTKGYQLRDSSPAIDAFNTAAAWNNAWPFGDGDINGNPIRVNDGYGTCGCQQHGFSSRQGMTIIFN